MDNHELNQPNNPLSGQEDIIVSSRIIEPNSSNANEPGGIGGWLILIAISVITSPLSILLTLFNTHIPQLTNGVLEQLSTPGNPAYSPLWKPTIMFEVCSNILMLILGIVIIYLFFSKKKTFPIVYIGMLILRVLVSIVDAALANSLQNSLSINVGMTNNTAQVVQAFGPCIIWTAYMLNSIRVKNTFIS